MTNPSQPRSPSRVGTQELTQLLIRSIDKLRTLPTVIESGNSSVVPELQAITAAITDQTVALEAQTTDLVAAMDANTAAITNCLSEIQQTYVAEGGAGLTTTADRATAFTIDNAWTELNNYDAKQLPEVDATGDPVVGTLTINATGIWAVSFSMDIDVTSSAANESRYLEIGLYNTVDDDFIVLGSSAIPRYGTRATLYGTIRFPVDGTNLSDPLVAAIRTPVGMSDVEATNVLAGGQFSCGRELTKL